jgi:hypothetical protein
VVLYWCARDEGGKGREEEKRRGEVGWVACVNRKEKEVKKQKKEEEEEEKCAVRERKMGKRKERREMSVGIISQ